MKEGDILYHVWGLAATNVEFYLVAKRTKCFCYLAKLDKIACDKRGNPCAQHIDGYYMPDMKTQGKPRKTRVSADGSVLADCGSFHVFTGLPVAYSLY
jgi:hypothetical protein